MREFYNDFFSLNLKDFNNIGIDVEINKVLFVFTVVIIIGAVFISYFRNSMVTVIKRLKRFDALTEESAKTLDEIRTNTFGARVLMRSSNRLKRIVKRVGEKDYSYEEYVELSKKQKRKKKDKKTRAKIKEKKKAYRDLTNARFYIRDLSENETKRVLMTRTTTVFNTVLFCVLIFAVFVCLLLLSPLILRFINDLLTR